jgi:hypothetical protein
MYVEVVGEYGFPYVRIIHIHNPEVEGSSPSLAILKIKQLRKVTAFFMPWSVALEWGR